MSLESWRKEYYPVDADKLTSRNDAVLIEASLLKWIGLQEGNLAEHGLEKDGRCFGFYVEDEHLSGTSHCALCTKYFRKDCVGCPLGSCSKESEYQKTRRDLFTNLTPLIKALAKTLDKELNHE